jgi:hypothetical protein
LKDFINHNPFARTHGPLSPFSSFSQVTTLYAAASDLCSSDLKLFCIYVVMEVRDLDQEHLEFVLKDDDDDHRNSELPPTSPARRTATPQHYTSIARRPNRGKESDTSRERYSLLPDYAQESFVTTNETVKNTSTDHSALLFQDLREDVEPNLPKNLVTVGSIFFISDEGIKLSKLEVVAETCIHQAR